MDEEQGCADDDEVDGPAEGDEPVEAVGGRRGVGLDALEQRVLAAGADDAEQEDVDVVQQARGQYQAGQQAHRRGQQDAQGALPGRDVAVEQRQQRQPVETHLPRVASESSVSDITAIRPEEGVTLTVR